MRGRGHASRNGGGTASAGRVVIIGPGRLGCGYLAPLFLDAGWETVLATHKAARAARIAVAGGFTVRMGRQSREFELPAPPVVVGTDPFRRAVSTADLVVMSVGRENVCTLGPPLAHAFGLGRSRPLDVWVVENADAAPLLEQAVRREAAREGIALPSVGFAGGVAFPVVASGSWDAPDRPEFVRDAVEGLLIDNSNLLTLVPRLPGVRGTSLYRARLREKLFMFNAGHALLAYLGSRCQYRRIDEAVRDPLLRTLVEGCLVETRRALIGMDRRLGSAVSDVAEAMRRYEDVELADTIQRVARRPIRKLDPDGPLIGAAELVSATFGRVPLPFVLAIASALLHSDRTDPEVRRLAAMLRRQGIQAVLLEVCGLKPDSAIARGVTLAYRRMCLGQAIATPAALRTTKRRPLAPRLPRLAVQAAAS